MQRQMDKKRKKKEAQRLKKLVAKGELPTENEDMGGVQITETYKTATTPHEQALEELRAKHMKELQELQLQHQRQLEEEARRLKVKNNTSTKNNTNNNVIPKNNNTKRNSLDNETRINRNEALNAKPGTQIKITRTPMGGVEFTTVPASNSNANHTTSSQGMGGGMPPMGMGMGNGYLAQASAPPTTSQAPAQVFSAALICSLGVGNYCLSER